MMLSFFLSLALACNTHTYDAVKYEYADQNDANAPSLTLLPQDKGNLSPAALDGSPYGFYFKKTETNSTKWTIYIQGGGWCVDEVNCYCRAHTDLGNSSQLPQRQTCGCINVLPDGSVDNDCNCLFLPYLDGASFSGYKADPVPVPPGGDDNVPKNATIYFRGKINLEETLNHALESLGLSEAEELVLTGASAGGLSTFLHADYVGAKVKAAAPNLKSYHALPQAGFFLDHYNYHNSTGGRGPNTRDWSDSKSGKAANYTEWMKYVYNMQNLTFGGDGLMKACHEKHENEPHLCFMSPHMVDVIETPLYIFNSKHDEWHTVNILQVPCGQHDHLTEKCATLVRQYGRDFMVELQPALNSRNGGFITSCPCHVCPYDLVLENKTVTQHFADWVYGKTSGSSAFTVDPNEMSATNGDLPAGHCKY